MKFREVWALIFLGSLYEHSELIERSKLQSAKLVLPMQFEDKKKRSERKLTIPDLSEDLRVILARSIEEGLDSLGGGVGQTILYHVEKEYSLRVDDMVERPESFMEALRGIFGAGAFTLEEVVVKALLRNMPTLKEDLRTRRFCPLITSLKHKGKLPASRD